MAGLKYQIVLDNLPVGVVVVTTRWRIALVNSVADALWDAAAAAEFGTREAVQKEFLDTAKAERGKPYWVARVVGRDPAQSLALHVHVGPPWEHDGQTCHSYVLVPETAEAVASPSGTYVYGLLRLDREWMTVMYGRDYVAVTTTEFRLLAFFCANPGQLLRKDRLLREVWGVRAGNTRTLDVTVSRLRRKLAASGCPEAAVRTLHGQGYLFNPIPLVQAER